MNSMSMHNVASITVSEIQTSGCAQWRDVTIRDVNGVKFEITMFSDEVSALTVQCDELASIKNKLLTLAEDM